MYSLLLSLCSRFFHGLVFLFRQFFVSPPYPIIYWSGKTVIVTGGTSGLGLESACHFVRLGAKKVIITARNPDHADHAVEHIVSSAGRKGVVDVWPLDLASYKSVKEFARRVEGAEGPDRLDAVVLSAAMASPEFRKAEQDELTVTVNFVSAFLLAFSLLPKLKDTANKHRVHPHLSFVSSEIIFQTSFPEADAPNIFEELNNKRRANMWSRYHITKLMVAMMCREISARRPANYNVVVNYLNPGLCRSNLLRHLPSVVKMVQLILARTAEEGSRLLVHAASAGPLSHGQYLSDAKIRDPPPLLTSKRGVDIQRRLWDELFERLEEIQPGVVRNL